jgi:hypothetical protein
MRPQIEQHAGAWAGLLPPGVGPDSGPKAVESAVKFYEAAEELLIENLAHREEFGVPASILKHA